MNDDKNLNATAQAKETKSKEKDEPKNTLPYSYHTFIFPFLFDSSKGASRNTFLEYLPELNKYLIKDPFDPKALDNDSYATYRYFNKAMRNAVYTSKFDDSAIVWNYRYDLDRMANQNNGDWLKKNKGEDNPIVIQIKKDNFCFELAVNGVRLKLFNTGVGMLVFELENYKHHNEESIIKINEYFRRVFTPFIENTENFKCSLCADEISLVYNKKDKNSNNSNNINIVSGKVSGVSCDRVDEIKLSPIITYFLSNGTKKVTACSEPKEDEFYIEPIIDDRMFVACIYGNGAFVDDMKQWDKEEKCYKFLSDAQNLEPDNKLSLARRLYEMIFVDGNGICCYSRDMLNNLLQKHSYCRWLEYGTLNGITEYSMICVTSGLKYVLSPFLSEYIEMLIIVLAQRASLLAFERIISDIACNQTNLDMKKLQAKYIKFQSELLLQEVTAQQQGIELYNMMLENLFITQQQNGIENQISSLFEMNALASERKENWILFLLSALSAVEVVDIVSDWFGVSSPWNSLFSGVLIGAAFLFKYCNRKWL